MTKRGKGDEDDGTTSQRDRLPRAPILAPDRPTIPQLGRTSNKRGVGKDDLIDDGPTMFDPSVPTGAAEQPPFDPHARIDDNRRTTPIGSDDDEPTGAKEKAPQHTVIGKRAAKPAAKGTPKVEPVPPVDPRELPTQRHKMPVKFDPTARIDDSSRTNKWQAEELADEPPSRDSGPPTNPLPNRSGEFAPVPRSGPQLPLAPGPQSAPIRAVSMKTPQALDAELPADRALPQVRIRAMSELNPHATPPQGMGYLAPPRDPNQARPPRRWQDFVIWGSLVVIVAAVVTLAVWFLAR